MPDSAMRLPFGMSLGSYKWFVVGILWFICFFNYADRQAISSVLPILGKEYHFDKTDQGLIGSAFMWVYAFGAPLAGLAADLHGSLQVRSSPGTGTRVQVSIPIDDRMER